LFQNPALAQEQRLDAFRQLRFLLPPERTIELALAATDELRAPALDVPTDVRAIALCGPDGLAAYLKRYPELRLDSGRQNSLNDARLRLVASACMSHTGDKDSLLAVLLEHPDRRELFAWWVQRVTEHSPITDVALARGIESASRHTDPEVRLRAVREAWRLVPEVRNRIARERLEREADSEIRTAAVSLIDKAEQGGPVDLVRAQLASPEPALRLQSWVALQRLKAHEPDGGVPVLLELAERLRKPPVPWQVWDGLRALPGGTMLTGIRSKEATERYAATSALRYASAHPEARDKWQPLLLALAETPEALAQNGYMFRELNCPCPGLLARLLPAIERARDTGFDTLAQRLAAYHPKEAVAEAEPRLKHADARVRWFALDLLVRADPERARALVPGLAPLFAAPAAPKPAQLVENAYYLEGPNPDPAFVWEKAKALRAADDALPWLLTALQVGQHRALEALPAFGPKLVPHLPELLAAGPYSDPVLRAAHVAALSAAGGEAAPALLAALEKALLRDPSSREELIVAVLAKLAAAPNVRPALEAWAHIRAKSDTAASIAARAGPELAFAPIWVAHLQGSPQQRALASDALAKFGPDAAPYVPALLDVLARVAKDDRDTTIAVAEVLGRIGPKAKDAVPRLIPLFERAYDPAVTACARIGRGAVPDLVRALRHESASVRGGAADALGRIGSAAKEDALAELLRLEKVEQNGPTRETVRAALKRLEPQENR
jgi:HEAT repeat protein